MIQVSFLSQKVFPPLTFTRSLKNSLIKDPDTITNIFLRIVFYISYPLTYLLDNIAGLEEISLFKRVIHIPWDVSKKGINIYAKQFKERKITTVIITMSVTFFIYYFFVRNFNESSTFLEKAKNVINDRIVNVKEVSDQIITVSSKGAACMQKVVNGVGENLHRRVVAFDIKSKVVMWTNFMKEGVHFAQKSVLNLDSRFGISTEIGKVSLKLQENSKAIVAVVSLGLFAHYLGPQTISKCKNLKNKCSAITLDNLVGRVKLGLCRIQTFRNKVIEIFKRTAYFASFFQPRIEEDIPPPEEHKYGPPVEDRNPNIVIDLEKSATPQQLHECVKSVFNPRALLLENNSEVQNLLKRFGISYKSYSQVIVGSRDFYRDKGFNERRAISVKDLEERCVDFSEGLPFDMKEDFPNGLSLCDVRFCFFYKMIVRELKSEKVQEKLNELVKKIKAEKQLL